MNAEYRRDPDGHYLVLGDLDQTQEDVYSLNMVLKNRIAGLLPMEREVLNGQTRLVYNISSKISFADLTEKEPLTQDLLRCLITDLSVCTGGFREYLLEIGKLMLLPEFIFLEQDTGRFRFCFNPYYTGNYQHDIRSLFDRILEKTDYEDPLFVKMVYEMHIAVQKDNFRISDLSDAMSRTDSSETVSVRDMFSQTPEPDRTDGEEYLSENEKLQRKEPASALQNRQPDSVPGTFGKLRNYLKGKNIREVISDIDNGVFLQKMNRPFRAAAEPDYEEDPPVRIRSAPFSMPEPKKQEPVKKTDAPPAKDMNEMLKKIPWTGGSDGEKELYEPVCCENEPQDRTVLLDQCRNRRLVGIGRQDGTVIEISRYPFLIGKLEEEMDCIIDRPSVSRMHARISENTRSPQDSCYIADLNSTNGTYINGTRIEPYQKKLVNTGDVIRLADQEFILR